MPFLPAPEVARMTPRLPLAAPVCLAFLMLPGAVLAQNSPYYAGASLGLTRVTNVFRTGSDGNSDTVTTAGLFAGLDQRLGRQHLSADATLQHNRYATNSGLNNQGYTLRSALDWETIGNLSGTLSAGGSQALADFNVGSGVEPIRKKNTETNTDYAALARLGVTTRYSLEAGYAWRKRDFSAFEYDRLATTQRTTSLSAFATPGARLRLGITVRRAQGVQPRYPKFLFRLPPNDTEPNDFRRDDLDLTATWDTGGSSRLTARLSRSRIDNSLVAIRNFSGNTGAIGWGWQPTGKLNLQANIARDTGLETQTRSADVNRVYWTYQFNATYAVTGKLALTASTADYRSTSRSDDARFGTGYDNSRNQTLGARWNYSRAISFSCQLSRSSRDSSIAAYAYTSNSSGCSAQALVY